LELSGKLSISRKNMLKFVGRALNTQNDIADNIYIFDAPEQVWDDEYLDKLHRGLKKHFDLHIRFSEVEYTLRIIEENLSVFREISNQTENSTLERIVILLILVEVLNLVISKLF
jgi:required for meiotic nuclear division protein 1